MPEELKPGRRDYIWTVDTLSITDGYFYPSRIWGSASNDVWLACTGSPSTNLLWHFDGVGWRKDSIPRLIDQYALWGSGSNDIWLGNSGNDFWRYNGVDWYKFTDVTPPSGYDRTTIAGIWGRGPSDVWGVGATDRLDGSGQYEGIIMHFNGGVWTYKTIPSLRVEFIDIRQQGWLGPYFMTAWRFEPTGDTSKVYLYDGRNTLTEIYSAQELMNIAEIRDQVYFLRGPFIYKYGKDGRLTLWRDFSNTIYAGWMIGRSEIDFLGITRSNEIVHYNGSDFAVLFHNTLGVWATFLVTDSVFFVCEDHSTNACVIIRGRLPSI